MARTTYSVPLNGQKVALGPFPFKVRSITPVNKCQNGNLIVTDDRGAQYVASAQTADTYAADDTTYATAYIDAINLTGSLAVIVSDEEPTNPVNNAQLSTLSGGGSGLILARVTTLPATPIDAQAVVYTPDPANFPGVEWWCVYNAGTGFWDVIGGPPLVAAVDTTEGANFNGAWGDLATIGPRIFVPNAGDYLMSGKATTIIGVGADAVEIGVSPGGSATSTEQTSNFTGAGGALGPLSVIDCPANGLTKSTEIRMRYSGGNQVDSWRGRILSVLPVRIK